MTRPETERDHDAPDDPGAERPSQFDRDTAITPVGPGRWTAHAHEAWCIGGTVNGGCALTPVLRALGELTPHPDPLSVTTHFLRPVTGGEPLQVGAATVRVGRTTSVARGTLVQGDRERLTVIAAFGDTTDGDTADDGAAETTARRSLTPELPVEIERLPPPEDCVDRRELTQGVELPILDRLDVRIHPDHAVAGGAGRAVVAGWIRLADGADPSVTSLPLFADAFPPSLYALLGEVGWVPTIELTVHVRARPAPGWIRAHFECDDLDDLDGGRMIESGTLWDATGRVVARSRQLGLLLDPAG